MKTDTVGTLTDAMLLMAVALALSDSRQVGVVAHLRGSSTQLQLQLHLSVILFDLGFQVV